MFVLCKWFVLMFYSKLKFNFKTKNILSLTLESLASVPEVWFQIIWNELLLSEGVVGEVVLELVLKPWFLIETESTFESLSKTVIENNITLKNSKVFAITWLTPKM